MLSNDHTALDTGTLELVQPKAIETVDPTQGEDVPAGTEPDQSTEPEPTPTASELELEGIGKVTLDEIREWKQGALRQSDYTKKTQELAKQREELADAMEVYKYLQENPQLVSTLEAIEKGAVNPVLRTTAPEHNLLREVMYNQKAMEVDKKLDALRGKYGEVDEVALFNKATELRTDDLEFVYKALKYDDTASVDQQALIEEAKRQLREELEGNKGKVQTIVGAKAGTNFQKTVASLTPEEKRVAEAMGMSPSDYLKWK